MVKLPGAGELRHRLAFDSRTAIDDGFGNTEGAGGWRERFKAWAALRPRGGSEAVVAARLEGRNLVGAYVHSTPSTRQITADWRVRVVRTGAEYAVIHVDTVTDPGWVYLDLRSGVAP